MSKLSGSETQNAPPKTIQTQLFSESLSFRKFLTTFLGIGLSLGEWLTR